MLGIVTILRQPNCYITCSILCHLRLSHFSPKLILLPIQKLIQVRMSSFVRNITEKAFTMNRTLYKVVFNKHRNSMMAVAENAKREGKNTADTQAVGILPNDISGFAGFIHSISVISLDLLRKYSSHCINQPRNQICP